MRSLPSLAFGIGLSALAAGLAASAQAATASLRGAAMPEGYARISLAFDEPTPMRVRVSNGVLIVAFGSAVTIDVGKIVKELPDHLSVARIDPDRRGMRFALARPYKANLIEAGDKAFIDLMPESWTGLLPGPPPEVVADLAERLRLAEARNRAAAPAPAAPVAPLSLRGAVLPTLDRLIFTAPPETRLRHELAEGRLGLTFDKPVPVDASAIRKHLPEGVALTSHETSEGATRLVLSVPQDRQIRSFRDDDGLIVDLVRPAQPAAVTLAGLATPPPAAAGPPAIAGAAPPAAPAGEPPAPLAEARPPVAEARPAPPVPAIDSTPRKVQVQSIVTEHEGRLDFRFPRPTGAAAFVDGDLVTLVFDTRDIVEPASLEGVLPRLVASASVTREVKATLVRLRLSSEQIVRLSDEGMTWSLGLGEGERRAADPVAPLRSIDERGQTIVAVPLPGMTGVHWLENGPAGLPMAVATALGPTRSVAKPYRYVEFSLLQSAHGLIVSPRADDVVVRAGAEQALIGRAGGLAVSPVAAPPPVSEAGSGEGDARPLVDPEAWAALRTGAVRERERELLHDVIDASRARKSEARLALARFYAANGLMSEAAGPLRVLLAEDPGMRQSREALFLLGAVAAAMHRDAEAVAALSVAPLRDDAEAGLWRALVERRLGRDGPALAGFRRGEAFLDRYPADLQGRLRTGMARAALALKDVTTAERQIGELAELPRDTVDSEELALLRAMLDDLGGRPEAALNGYKPLFEAGSRPVAAEAQLRAVKLIQTEKRADMTIDEAIGRLETVSVIWRGGDLEIEALSELGKLYAQQKRWRDAFMVARRANETFPDSPLTRAMHDETAQRFAELFSEPGGEAVSRIETLALFYDFKEFLPIGRRGDEITRLLADRLVELDLLDQASQILRHQIEKRLTGAARSTLAARVAMIALMNGKPAEALQILASTRLPELPGDVRRARLLLEAKALSDLSRTDQALELLEGESGTEIERLKADIFWTGRRWREAGEAHERLLGESWRGAAPLGDGARADAMRAAISYAMADEALSLDRLRTKFSGKMAQSSDARTFAAITGANRASAADRREAARAAAGADTFSEFLKAYRERYPDMSTAVRQKQEPGRQTSETPPQGAASPAPAPPGRG